MKRLIILVALAITAINAFSQNIIKGEYFIDTDPGFGSATEFFMALPDSDLTESIVIPYESFPGPGYHNLFLRIQDSNGDWSHTSRIFVDLADNTDMEGVIKVEYFFNEDKGFGNNPFVIINASTDSTWNINIPFDQLPSEWKTNDTLSLRVQEGTNKNWSLTALIDSLNFIMVGISELEQNTGVTVYPNPFSDEINISVENYCKMRFVLYNINGKLIFDKQIEKSAIINTRSLIPGVYVVAIFSENEKQYGTKITKL